MRRAIKAKPKWTIKKTLKFIRNNLALMFLLPTFIGGLWQVIELAIIDLSYIRFFSVTQLISDGILILVLSPVLIFVTYFSHRIASFILGDINRFSRKPDRNKIKLFLISASLTTLLTVIYVTTLSVYNRLEGIYFYDIIYFFFVIIFISYHRLFMWENVKLTPEQIQYRGKFELFASILHITSLLSSTIIVSLLFVKVLSEVGQYKFPQNLANLKYVEIYLRNEYDIALGNYQIVYFNDTYIFGKKFDHYEKTKFEIVILPFDILFNTKEWNSIPGGVGNSSGNKMDATIIENSEIPFEIPDTIQNPK